MSGVLVMLSFSNLTCYCTEFKLNVFYLWLTINNAFMNCLAVLKIV